MTLSPAGQRVPRPCLWLPRSPSRYARESGRVFPHKSRELPEIQSWLGWIRSRMPQAEGTTAAPHRSALPFQGLCRFLPTCTLQVSTMILSLQRGTEKPRGSSLMGVGAGGIRVVTLGSNSQTCRDEKLCVPGTWGFWCPAQAHRRWSCDFTDQWNLCLLQESVGWESIYSFIQKIPAMCQTFHRQSKLRQADPL